MAEVTIRFRYNKRTGKNEIVIGYESDSDALPHEHERDHKALAEELLGRKLDDDAEELIVERVTKKQGAPEAEREAPVAGRKAEAEKGG